MNPQDLSLGINEIMGHIVIAKNRAMNQDYGGAREQIAQAKKRLSDVSTGYSPDHPVIVSCNSHINFLEETLP